MADQMTDMILCSLNYFVPGEKLAGTEIPEGRGQVRVQPLLTSHRQNQKHSAFRSAATWAVSMSPSFWRNEVTIGRCPQTATVKEKTTTEAEWNPRPSAYQPSYCLNATPSWPPKLRDNPVCDYMCIALAVGSIGPTAVFSVLTRQAGSKHQSVCSPAM